MRKSSAGQAELALDLTRQGEEACLEARMPTGEPGNSLWFDGNFFR